MMSTSRVSEDSPVLNESDIKRFIKEAETKESIFNEQFREIERQHREDSAKFNDAKTRINRRNEELKKEHERIASRLLASCAEHEKANANKLDEWKKFYERKQQNLKSKILQLKSILSSGDLQNAKDISKNLGDSDENPPVSPGLIISAKLTYSTVPIDVLERLHGDMYITEYRHHTDGYTLVTRTCALQSSNVPQHSIKDKAIVTSFSLSSEISCMALTPDSEAWIACTKKPRTSLLKVNQNGEVTQTLPIKCDVMDICLSPTTDNLWICNSKDKAAMALQDLFFNTKVNTLDTPFRLCITKDETVVMCFQNKIEEFRHRQSIRTNPGGNNMRPKGSVKNPVRIKQCGMTGDFAVCDMDDISQGGQGVPSVLVMDKKFVEKFRYYGKNIDTKRCPGVHRNTRIEFVPVDACFDNLGNLLIADKITKSILLVNREGVYIDILHTSAFQPKTVSMRNGYVWVGYENKSVEILTYELVTTPPLLNTETKRSWFEGVFDFFAVLREYYSY